MFKPTFKIDQKSVGQGAPVLVIAEAGVAHFGDMDLARQLVDLAIEAKADVFKTQFFDVDNLMAGQLFDWKDRLRPRNLTLDQAFELKKRCEDNGVVFMATAHDSSRLSWLKELDVPAIKIGSGERNNLPFIQSQAELGKPVILSTGMYREQDIKDTISAVQQVGCEELALLQCTTSYPTPAEHVNLSAMDSLSSMFEGPVGYSDHTIDGLAILASVAKGAKIVEKHITILRDIPNAQDWKVSSGPEDFPQLVSDIRRIETMLGSAELSLQESEIASEHWALKSIVAIGDFPAGHVLSEEDVIAKRPGDGISPDNVKKLLGKTLVKSIKKDTLFSWDHF